MYVFFFFHERMGDFRFLVKKVICPAYYISKVYMRIIITTFSLCSLTTNWPPQPQIFSDSKDLVKLNKQRQLGLGNNQFNKEILKFLGALSSRIPKIGWKWHGGPTLWASYVLWKLLWKMLKSLLIMLQKCFQTYLIINN